MPFVCRLLGVWGSAMASDQFEGAGVRCDASRWRELEKVYFTYFEVLSYLVLPSVDFIMLLSKYFIQKWWFVAFLPIQLYTEMATLFKVFPHQHGRCPVT